MPTNLPPDYFNIEEEFRRAQTVDEKIAKLEQLISTVPKHKGTDKLRADLRQRLSKLKSAADKQTGGVSRQVSAYSIEREGAGQVALTGVANVGKSALVASLTHASPEVAAHPFTTWTPTPGMMPVGHVQIQLIDTPPLNDNFIETELLNLLRRVDLLLLVVDVQAFPIQQLEDALALLEANRIAPAHRRDQYDEPHRWTFVPTLVVVNKVDDAALEEDFEVFQELVEDAGPMVAVSAETGHNVDTFKQTVFDQLGIIRIYAKPPGREADLTAPFTMKKGGTVADFARKVHRDFYEQLKSTRVWGTGVFDGQAVSRDHVLHDGDIVELHI